MGKIIAFVNQKGGVGKTTSSINLAASLGLLGEKTLLIDLDPQGNATTGVGVDKGTSKATTYELLTDKANVQDVVIKTHFKNLYMMPASINLAGVGNELRDLARENSKFIPALQLKKHLRKLVDVFDYVIIDCPPSLEIITTNALAAADSVIIPVQCEFFALEGIMQLLSSIKLAQKKLNPELDIEGVLLTMLDSRANLGLEVVEDIRSYFKDKVYDTIIPRLVRLAEAPSHGKPIHAYDPRSRGTEAYLNLAKEVIERNGK